MSITKNSFVRQRAIVATTAGLALGIVVAGCTASGPDTAGPAGTAEATFGHVHGLGVDSTSGAAFAATHNGVFALPPLDAAPASVAELGGPIAGLAQDTMGFTMDGRQMFGSGHPDPADESAPSNLGFITSTDDAKTWETISLRGEKDFHEIEVVQDSVGRFDVFAVDSSTGGILISRDGGASWQPGGDVLARDLAAEPESETVYATTEEGLAVSSDGGLTFEVDSEAPVLYLIDWVDDASDGGLVGIGLEGNVWTRLGTEGWTRSGFIEGPAHAMSYAASPEPVLLVADARGIVASDDFGSTWNVVVTP